MRHTLLACCLVLWHSSSIYANDQTMGAALAETLPQHCLLSGNFTQTRRLRTLPAPLVSSGQFFFSCHNGLIWQTESPINETLVYTQQEYYFQIKEEQSPQLLQSRLHDHLAKILLGLMSADKHYLQEQFTINNESNNKMSFILKPKDKQLKRGLKKIILRQENALNTIKIVNINKETTRIVISNTQDLNWQSNNHTQSFCQDLTAKIQLACDILMQPKNHLTLH
ncbi:MAG: outer membrane lipoprotein carrier protein LolA [Gammaproteobacteria bacterium]|nr:outer membrane lipoprotein carrier protein LolA [Gammaproteobacteria bacterium]